MAEAQEHEVPQAIPPATTPGSTPRLAVGDVVLEGLTPLAEGLTAVFALFIVFDGLTLPGAALVPILAGNAALVAGFLCLWIVLDRGLVTAHMASPVAAIVGFGLEANVLLHLRLLSDLMQTVYVVLLIAGTGFFLLSSRWLLPTVGGMYLLWALMAFPIATPTEMAHLSAALFTASAVAVIVRTARVGHLRRLHRAMALATAESLERSQAERALGEKGEQLLQAQKMEAVGQLAGGLAHDFNNMLTGITGYCELALGTLNDGSAEAEDIRKVLRISRHAAGLTRQLLAFSRRQSLEPQILNINRLVAKMSAMLERLIDESIDMVFVAAPDIGNVRADPAQLEQVLMNLVVNARDAMPDGGSLTIETANVTLTEEYCELHAEASPGPHVMLAVTDTGCGMDEDTLRQVFEPFFTTKGKTQGTGLGLATVYGIAKQHGGNVSVYSEPGRGTTFKVYLPRADEELTVATEGEEVEAEGRGSGTILVVEDNSAVREVVRRPLEAHGYRVLLASTPSEAVALFAADTGGIDLLVTDIVLPEMDGATLYEKLSEQDVPLRVVFMSGYNEAAVTRDRATTSTALFLQKPFTPAQLLLKVEEALVS